MRNKKTKNTGKDSSKNLQKANDLFPTDPNEQQALEKIYSLLLENWQVDFSQYRDTTILRRLNRRMNLCKQDNYTDYLKFLKKNSTETEQLFYDLLLSYTHFFRDTFIFDTLIDEVFPSLVKNRSARKPIRIWIPGCSSGEEVYSMAICLYEFMADNKIKVPVKIFGTDLVEQHIVTARTGIYNDKIREAVSEERLERFFDKTPEGLKVIKHIREMCVFAIQDITQDPPFPNIDLISCRNVLIYFDAAYQDAAIPRFHFSLNPDGFLLLGSSETMVRFTELFDIVDRKANLYSKRLTAAKPDYHFTVTQKSRKLKSPAVPEPADGSPGTATESTQISNILLDAYAPPGVLVDRNLMVRRFIGNTHPYLSPVSGEASLKLPRMAGNTLMPDIYTAVQSAKKKKEKVRKKNVAFQNNGQETFLNICVIPVNEQNINETDFLILFEKAEVSPADSQLQLSKSGKDRSEVDHLKQELQQTKEHLQSIIEEKDGVNQELWAANEEIMSTNEELQSVNEEMEASKEELESGNEELLALNEELQMKNVTIDESEEKQRLLLQNIHAGVVVHAPDTSILMANNRACEILSLTIDQMMGKTAMDPAWRFLREDGSDMPLEEYPVNQVIAKQAAVRFLAVGINRPQTNDVAWVLVHAFPEMEADGTLRQVVVTFVDITELKKAENDLKDNQKKFKDLADSIDDVFFALDKDLNYTYWNEACSQLFGRSAEKMIGKPYLDFEFNKSFEWIADIYKEVINSGQSRNFESFFELDDKKFWYDIKAYPSFFGCSVIVKDITERKLAEQEIRESEKLLRKMADNYPNSYISIINKDYTIGFTGGGEFKKLNLDPEQFVGLTLEQVFGDKADFIRGYYKKTFSGKEQSFELFINDQYQLYRTVPLLSDDGSIERIFVVVENITERREAEKKVRESEEKFRHLYETMTQGVVIQDTEGKIIEANSAAADILGVTEDQLFGRTAYDPRWKLIREDGSPYDPAEMPSNIVLRTGKPVKDVTCGIYVPEKDEYRWIVIGSAPQFKDDESEPSLTMTVFTDITERRRSEKKILALNNQMQSGINNMPNAYILWDTDLKVVEWNKAAETIFGYTKDEMLGKNPINYIVPEPVRHLVGDVLKKLKVGEVADYSEKDNNIRKDGKTISCQWYNTPLADSKGEIWGILTLAQDITERKQAEEALKASEEKFSKAFTLNPNTMAIIDTDTLERIAINDYFVKLIGYSREKLMANPFGSLGEFDPEKIQMAVKAVKKGVSLRDVEVIMTDSKGSKRVMLYAAEGIKIGERNCMIVSGKDITERWKAEEELEKHRLHLEELVELRTQELQEEMGQQKKLLSLMAGREVRMAELKKVIKKLRAQLDDAGITPIANDPLLEPDNDW